MEYVFGTKKEKEILRTKGDAHSDLAGYHQIIQEYPDQNIIDNFRVVQKTNTAEDSEGNCYDWYEIDNHYRTAEKKNVPTVLKVGKPVPIPAGGSSASYQMAGLTDRHILLNWGGPGENLNVIIHNGEFTVVNSGESISAVVQPIFAIPETVNTTTD